MPPTPLPFRWTGEAFEPLPGFRKQADAAFVVGEVYRLDTVEQRSDATHKHEFAWLREAWANLPENLADEYATPEHLRKSALIDAGFYDETTIDAGTNAAALRVATAIRGMDDFARVVVRGPLVVRRTAKSQSRRAMDGKTFQASKTAVLDVVSAMIGVAPEQLTREAGKAA